MSICVPTSQLLDHFSQASRFSVDAATAVHHLEVAADAFLPHRQGTEAVFVIERGTELRREWSLPMYLAQVDLKRASDILCHSQVASVLSRKNVSRQLAAVQVSAEMIIETATGALEQVLVSRP